MAEVSEKESRIEVEGVPARLLMGMDRNGEKRLLRCDEEGFLLCKVVEIESAEFEVNEG